MPPTLLPAWMTTLFVVAVEFVVLMAILDQRQVLMSLLPVTVAAITFGHSLVSIRAYGPPQAMIATVLQINAFLALLLFGAVVGVAGRRQVALELVTPSWAEWALATVLYVMNTLAAGIHRGVRS